MIYYNFEMACNSCGKMTNIMSKMQMTSSSTLQFCDPDIAPYCQGCGQTFKEFKPADKRYIVNDDFVIQMKQDYDKQQDLMDSQIQLLTSVVSKLQEEVNLLKHKITMGRIVGAL